MENQLSVNTAASKEAEEVFALLDHPQPDHFYSRLIELCKGKLPPAPNVQNPKGTGLKSPMNDQEATRFEAQQMEFGVHKNKEIGTIDPEYLVWLTEGNTFVDKLKRYVNSNRFKHRMSET